MSNFKPRHYSYPDSDTFFPLQCNPIHSFTSMCSLVAPLFFSVRECVTPLFSVSSNYVWALYRPQGPLVNALSCQLRNPRIPWDAFHTWQSHLAVAEAWISFKDPYSMFSHVMAATGTALGFPSLLRSDLELCRCLAPPPGILIHSLSCFV